MEIVTGQITATQVQGEVIPDIVELLRSLGVDDLLVEYGWGCRIDTNKLWSDMEVKVGDLPSLAKRSIEEGIYVPNQCDLILQDRSRTFTFNLCHESDIHLTTENPTLIEKASKQWAVRGYGGFRRSADGNWSPLC
jgi:hypothetical protein